jgi:hypothetical protein
VASCVTECNNSEQDIKLYANMDECMSFGNVTGLDTSCVRNAFLNSLLSKSYKGREDEEEDVISYRITLRISMNVFGMGQKPSPVCVNVLS